MEECEDMLEKEPYQNFEFVPNSLSFLYPKQVQKQLLKKKSFNLDKVIIGLKPPKCKHRINKNIEKMRALSKC